VRYACEGSSSCEGRVDEEARRRVDAQADDRTRLAVADVVVDSSGSLEHTLEQADDLYDRLRSLSAAKQAASPDASVGGPS
jgi:dephospho-CoA kinase